MKRYWLALIFIFAGASAHGTVLDDARSSYANGEFESFFGLAQWARLAQPQELSESDRDQLLALELMGLARHCQWEPITRLKNEIDGPFALKAFELIAVKSEYRRFAADPRNRRLSMSNRVVHSREHWGVDSKEAKRISAPVNLKAKVRSLCATS